MEPDPFLLYTGVLMGSNIRDKVLQTRLKQFTFDFVCVLVFYVDLERLDEPF
jgi:hypothetical protein